MTGFNKSLYRKMQREEPELHLKTRLRVEALLQKDGFTLIKPVKMTVETSIGTRDYTPDIYCEKSHRFMIVEIDGDSHEDDTRSWKDEVRDAAFKELGIPTCRITTEEGLSRFRMTDEEILERITAVFNKA